MKAHYSPSGGRFGFGFDYWCADCGAYLGNSIADAKLTHPTTETKRKWWYKKEEIPSRCLHAGKTYALPCHEIEVAPSL